MVLIGTDTGGLAYLLNARWFDWDSGGLEFTGMEPGTFSSIKKTEIILQGPGKEKLQMEPNLTKSMLRYQYYIVPSLLTFGAISVSQSV